MKTLRFLVVSAMVAIALLLGIQSTSHALQLGFNDGINPVIYISDNGPGNINPMVGVVTFSGGIGAWIVNVTTGISKPVLGSNVSPWIDLNSVNVTSAAGGNLRFGVWDQGFTGPVSGTVAGPFNFDVGGTIATGGSIYYDVYGDALNRSLDTAFGAPILFSVGPFFPPPTAFSGSGSGTLSGVNGPFALGIVADITHPAGSTSLSSSFDASLQGGKIPEPFSLILLGSGLAGVGLYRRLRKPRG